MFLRKSSINCLISYTYARFPRTSGAMFVLKFVHFFVRFSALILERNFQHLCLRKLLRFPSRFG
jgi:hypothetical protein